MAVSKNLSDFEQRLREVAGNAPWPFLCEGSPYHCEIFLVGVNPATDTPLWPHWSTHDGVNREGWLRAYREKHGEFRPTRRRINHLVEKITPCRILETNMFSTPSRREKDLPIEARTTETFEFLLRELKPKILLLHGKSASSHLEQLTKRVDKFPQGNFVKSNYADTELYVLRERHLYNWSYEDVEKLAGIMKNKLGELNR